MIIDILFFIFMIMAVIKGYNRGLIVALFSILAFIIGIAAAMKLSAVVANNLKESISVSSQWLPIISFIVVFIIVVLLVRLGAKLIEKTFRVVLLGWVNKLSGVLLFAVLYTIILSIILFYAKKMNIIKHETIVQSATYNYIEPWGPKVIDGFGKIIPLFKNMFNDLESFFDNISKKVN